MLAKDFAKIIDFPLKMLQMLCNMKKHELACLVSVLRNITNVCFSVQKTGEKVF